MSGMIDLLYTKIKIEEKRFMTVDQVPPTLLFEKINSKIGLRSVKSLVKKQGVAVAPKSGATAILIRLGRW